MAKIPVAFGIVSSMMKGVLGLLLAGRRVSGVTNSVVVPVEFVVCLGFVVGKASGFGGFDDKKIEYDNK